MAAFIYTLCSLASLWCGILLWRGYRKTKLRLLFWSAACFIILGLANVLLFVDLTIAPGIDLRLLRNAVTLTALLVLIYGLIFESN